MRDYFRSGKQPEDIERLTNKHWLRCIYHHDTHEHDWLLFAKAHSIYYYDLDKMRLLDLKAQNLKENVMCFEKVNDRYMMVGSGRVICFWDVENARQVGKQSQHHDKYINKIYYIKKKRTVLSGGDDGFIYLYRMKESKPELSLRQKISPSGSTEKSFIDSLIYFEGQAMLFCSNRTNSLTIFCFNSSNNLKEKSQEMMKLKLDAEEKMKRGIKRLLGYECKKGGFEWFGSDPGHVTLTAYGVWQFIEMNQLGDHIDPDIIDRTLDWLRKAYNCKDSEFKISASGCDDFGNPPQFCSDIYIVFILTMLDDYDVKYRQIVEEKLSKIEEGSGENLKDVYLASFVSMIYLGKPII